MDKKIHIFGENGEWAISVDDGCLRFHPQWDTDPQKTSSWIWREAFEEVLKLGGFEKAIQSLQSSPVNG